MPIERSDNASVASIPSAGTGNAVLNVPRINTRAEPTPTSGDGPSNLARAGNAWTNRGRNHLKSIMANSAANSVAGPRGPPTPRSGLAPANVANVASQLGRMQVNAPIAAIGGQVYNPSLGPTPSTMSTMPRQPLQTNSQVSTGSFRQVVHNAVCKISGYSRRDFRLGDVVSLPFHTPNTNPNTQPNEPRLTMTCEGPVYSKRRMAIVLWMYQRDMFCLPLFTFEHNGLRNKPQYLHKEYVSMRNRGSTTAVAQGPHKPIEVQCRRKPIDDETVVHIAGGFRVACNEDIAFVGRLTRVSHTDLVELWRALSGEAQREDWRD